MIKKILAPILTAFVFAFILSGIGAFAKSVFLNSAGDAARYFTPEPDNIDERIHIRQQGILFLQKLHKIATHEKVDRIIILAHSLGTVVAYDLMRLLWTEYNELYKQQLTIKQHFLEKIDQFESMQQTSPSSRIYNSPAGTNKKAMEVPGLFLILSL